MTRFIANSLKLDESKWVLLGIPMDFTVSRKSGSRFGSESIRAESLNLETYSPSQNRDLSEICFYDLEDLSFPYGDVQQALDTVEKVARRLLARGKYLAGLGGEHLVSLPLIRAAASFWPDLRVVHFDAHADLRTKLRGGALSHSSVMRHVSQTCLGETHRLYQFGIRSGCSEEMEWGRTHTNLNLFDVLDPLKKSLEELGSHPVYLSIDIDVVDPAAAPGTGTPEAGGITSRELLESIHSMKGLNLVGFDLVEVAPDLDVNDITSALAAKCVREALIQWG
ncbi:MAG: agmatinase [Synergistales bacterium]